MSKYLNKNFHSYDTLLSENLYKIDDLDGAKEIYKKLINYGDAFKWFSNKQIARILIQENKIEESDLIFQKLIEINPEKGIYQYQYKIKNF